MRQADPTAPKLSATPSHGTRLASIRTSCVLTMENLRMRTFVLFFSVAIGTSLLSACIVEPGGDRGWDDHARYEHDGRDHHDGGYERRDERRER
jgi:hypothetical protein